MNRRFTALSLALLLAAAGCARHSGDEEQTTTPMPPDLAGVYGGAFPCANCKEIAAMLWLRGDGLFFLRQGFVLESGTTESSSYSFGHWRWDEASAELVLSGRGPDRRFAPLDHERLEMRTASPLEHVLERDSSAPPFADRVQLQGESAVTDKGATFTQCVTGLALPIGEAGAYKELRRQHRVLNPRRKVALTTVEAHLVNVDVGESTREVLVVDKVVEPIKPGKGC